MKTLDQIIQTRYQREAQLFRLGYAKYQPGKIITKPMFAKIPKQHREAIAKGWYAAGFSYFVTRVLA